MVFAREKYIIQMVFRGKRRIHRFQAVVLCVYTAKKRQMETDSIETDKKISYQIDGGDKQTMFANIDDEAFEDEFLSENVIELGDIIMAVETLEDEAKIKSILVENHFAHLLIHGILHLFGYDHIEDDEAEEMEGIEVDILKELGIADPYEE